MCAREEQMFYTCCNKCFRQAGSYRCIPTFKNLYCYRGARWGRPGNCNYHFYFNVFCRGGEVAQTSWARQHLILDAWKRIPLEPRWPNGSQNQPLDPGAPLPKSLSKKPSR